MKRENPAFTLFADDVLAWEPMFWLTETQLGQVFKLVVYACKNGSTLPADHPLIGVLDPTVVTMCTRREGDHLAVVRPCDLPRLMLDRQKYLDARRQAGSSGGRKSVETRRAEYGTADPRGNRK